MDQETENKLIVYGVVGFLFGMGIKLLTGNNMVAIVLASGIVAGVVIKKLIIPRLQSKKVNNTT